MKTAMVVSASATAFESLAMSAGKAGTRGLEQSFRLIADMGFDGVEVAVRDPARVDPRAILNLARKHALEIPAIGTGQAFVDEGLSFTDPRAGIRKKAVKRIKDQLLFARLLDARVIIGLIRGRLEQGMSVEKGLELLAECLKECADFAKDNKCPVLMIEPINRYETRLLNSLRETRQFVKRLGRKKVRLMADTFHMNIEDADMEKALRESASLLEHVHLADSNRWAPGQGHLDFKAVFSTLDRIGYKGWLSMEILPRPEPREAVRLSARFLEKHGYIKGGKKGKG